MRLLYLATFAANPILSTALMSRDWFEDVSLDNQEPPYEIATNVVPGSQCSLNEVISDGFQPTGIQLPRNQCLWDLSVLGATFDADREAQTMNADYMKQPQCCVAVSCQASGISGYCTNSEKPCYDDSYEMPGDCPASQSKCCVQRQSANSFRIDGTESFTALDESSSGDQWGTGDIFGDDILDEENAVLAFAAVDEETDFLAFAPVDEWSAFESEYGESIDPFSLGPASFLPLHDAIFKPRS